MSVFSNTKKTYPSKHIKVGASEDNFYCCLYFWVNQNFVKVNSDELLI